MREILFRGKRTDNGEWVEGLLWKKKYNTNKLFISCFPDKDDNEEVFVIYPETVGQYTGLTDKNGTKIFEGDIVEYSNKDDCYYDEEVIIFVGKIKYEAGAFGIVTQDILPDLGYSSYCANDKFISLWEISWNENETEDCINSIEVIGNIHDNPELIKGAGK